MIDASVNFRPQEKDRITLYHDQSGFDTICGAVYPVGNQNKSSDEVPGSPNSDEDFLTKSRRDPRAREWMEFYADPSSNLDLEQSFLEIMAAGAIKLCTTTG